MINDVKMSTGSTVAYSGIRNGSVRYSDESLILIQFRVIVSFCFSYVRTVFHTVSFSSSSLARCFLRLFLAFFFILA